MKTGLPYHIKSYERSLKNTHNIKAGVASYIHIAVVVIYRLPQNMHTNYAWKGEKKLLRKGNALNTKIAKILHPSIV
jgi:hypothetical protein